MAIGDLGGVIGPWTEQRREVLGAAQDCRAVSRVQRRALLDHDWLWARGDLVPHNAGRGAVQTELQGEAGNRHSLISTGVHQNLRSHTGTGRERARPCVVSINVVIAAASDVL